MADSNTITSFDPLPAPPQPTRTTARRTAGPRATYDAARLGDDNSRKHWANADFLSANAANAPDVRARLRSRSRYELANNGYAKGLVRRRTNDTIGTGPRLQLDLPGEYTDPDFQRTIRIDDTSKLTRGVERRWTEWCEAVGFTDKLRLAADAEDGDGEVFGVFVSNPLNPPGLPRLDVRLYEADQCATPGLFTETPLETDGIVFDAVGNPVEYHFLKQHPGDVFTGVAPLDYTRIPARLVIHVFERHRPGQTRGVPILTPGLPLYAILRRYTLASLLTAEAQARIHAVIEQEQALADCDPELDANGEPVDDGAGEQIHYGGTQLLTLSSGQRAHTLDSSAPAPGYAEFVSKVLTENGMGVGAPRNVATGSSAEYNYASGRLDHLPYQGDIRGRRERYERAFTDRVYRAWLAEAVLIPGYLPDGLPPVASWEWRWHWDGFPSIDPLKDANAAKVRKEIGLTTDAEELAREGKDWREHYAQLAREKAERKRLDIEPEPKPAAQVAAARDAEQVAALVIDHLAEAREGSRP